jgi:galactokinase
MPMSIESKNELIKRNTELFRELYSEEPEWISICPGRINIIGEHTDYNHGLAMPAAIDRWIVISLRRNKGTLKTKIHTQHLSAEYSFRIGSKTRPKENWEKYVFGVVEILNQRYQFEEGFFACITSNIPVGAGVSSSAALEIALFNGLKKLYGLNLDDQEIVRNCQRVEHEYLNQKSGLMDPYTCLFAEKDKVMLLDFISLKHKFIEARSDQWAWVLVNPNLERSLSESNYSQRVKEMEDALEYLISLGVMVSHYRDLREEHLSMFKNETMRKRIKHYYYENQRVLRAWHLINASDYIALGSEMTSSHNSLKNDYEVSNKEMDWLVEASFSFKACAGSRMMGGGFGGCIINLVEKEFVNEFREYITEAYMTKYHKTPLVETFSLVTGAEVIAAGDELFIQ